MTVVGAPPATKHVTGSNEARVHVRVDPRTGRVLALGVLDNLVKGAAGQARPGVQPGVGPARDRGAPPGTARPVGATL